jgi:hypothetical protein
MKWILFCVAIFWIAVGTWGNLYPIQAYEKMRQAIETIAARRLAVVALVVGLLLLVAAPASGQGVGFIRLIGLLGIAKGVVFFFLPKDRFERMLDWWFTPAKEQSWRVWGLVSLVLGVVLLSWI